MNQSPVLTEVYADVRDLLDRAYDAGFQAGCIVTRDRIMQAVQQPLAKRVDVPEKSEALRAGAIDASIGKADRAPRGALRAAIQKSLRQQPGATEKFLLKNVPEIDPRVSARSIGGELRRMKGAIYRQDGFRWFNIESPMRRSDSDFGENTDATASAAD